ncbi:MAG TPA: hypothetical protein VHG53_01490 [Candidatus Limnocylindria bacterium]|nr:hypothetical protein [Candidatus Limnocylindria bacterium]
MPREGGKEMPFGGGECADGAIDARVAVRADRERRDPRPLGRRARAARHCVDAREELERLRDVVVRARGEEPELRREVIARGHHDDGQLSGHGAITEPFGEVRTDALRETEIHDRDVGASRPVQRLVLAGSTAHDVARAREMPLDCAPHGLVVLDDERRAQMRDRLNTIPTDHERRAR